MGREIAGKSPAHPPEMDWVSLLKGMEASQLAKLFHGGFCSHCLALLKSRVLSLSDRKHLGEFIEAEPSDVSSCSSEVSTGSSSSNTKEQHGNHGRTLSASSASVGKAGETVNLSPTQLNGKTQMRSLSGNGLSSDVQNHRAPSVASHGLFDEEWRRFAQVGRKKDFVCYEKVDGRKINLLQGLELHTGVFSAEEQKKVVESVYDFQRRGRKGQLLARTYSEPKKWMRGKGRVTIQFGCCYNYAVDKNGNPPGIIKGEEVDPLPPIFKKMIERMVRWHVLPPTCIPNSCIVNIFDEGDCIPPHIDHHDFLRPFCTVSFLTECNILFGTNLKVAGPGEFSGPSSIPLPVGSVLVLKGNGADVAKHCVPAVPAKRISVTFRRMDDRKIPYSFSPDPDLQNLKPLVRPSSATAAMGTRDRYEDKANAQVRKQVDQRTVDRTFVLQKNDFPPLGGSKS